MHSGKRLLEYLYIINPNYTKIFLLKEELPLQGNVLNNERSSVEKQKLCCTFLLHSFQSS